LDLHTIIPFCTWIVTSVSEPGFTSPELGLTLYFSGDVVFTCQRKTNIYSTGCFTLVIITWNICSCFRQYLMRGLICHLSKSSIRPSIYFSLKSWNLAGILSWNRLSSRQLGYISSKCFRETTETFGGVRTHDWQITSQTHHAAL